MYSVLNRKEILTQAVKCMNLEDIMLSEIKPVSKRKIHYDPTHIDT